MKKWWMESVGYQIYIKSFFDGNNDGIGDLEGIINKLDYLHQLGINLIWITPFYDSPMDDNGYDVRDYEKIAKEYGTIEDFKLLVEKAHSLGIKVILDFVLNHTSDEHKWFLESRKSLDNPYRDYYIWQKPKIVDGVKKEPTNWASFFGGSAWQYDSLTDEYYMKIFSNKMPDLNWKNPNVVNEMVNVGKWWLDLGVDGFRIDAVSHLDRAEFVDSEMSKDIVLDWFKFSNLPKVHDYLNQLYTRLFEPNNAFTIGEVGGSANIEQAIKYAKFDSKELSMVFNFDHCYQNNLYNITDLKDLKVNVIGLKNTLSFWQENFNNVGWLPLNWLNHDQPRLVSQYGDINFHRESATMLALIMYFSKGTPFIYQGEEIGMTSYPFTKESEFNDISTLTRMKYVKENLSDQYEEYFKKAALDSRDNPRTMMQWKNTDYAGFSKVKPWFLVNPNYKKINVEDQLKDENSILNFYKKIISLRRFSMYNDVLTYGDYRIILKDHPDVYAYIRSNNEHEILVIGSFSKTDIELDLKEYILKDILISNYKDVLVNNNKITLRPYETVSFEIKEKK